jgi:hypothetical protein
MQGGSTPFRYRTPRSVVEDGVKTMLEDEKGEKPRRKP